MNINDLDKKVLENVYSIRENGVLIYTRDAKEEVVKHHEISGTSIQKLQTEIKSFLIKENIDLDKMNIENILKIIKANTRN